MAILNFKRQLLVSGAILTIHNTEEAIGFASFTYPSGIKLPMQASSPLSMIWSIILFTVIAWIIIVWAYRLKTATIQRNILTAFVAVFITNAFIPHIAGTILLHRYVPGVVTAVILYILYSFWIVAKLYRLFPSPKSFYRISLLSLLISFVLVIVLLQITNCISC